ncbi:class I SAM-dependent methyltransferase [Candidatus Kaiserbacteria bacterium]|nr:class I SAM-dependent methyltransferase [Candidatus Kaiserbacteria bacterium]
MNFERCYNCGSAEYRPIAVGYLRCRTCGLGWLPRRSWPKDQERHYSEEYYPENYAGRKNKGAFSYRFRLVKQYLVPQGELLEIGAASGDFLALLREAGYAVRGVELSKRAAEQARRNYGLAMIQGTLERAKFETGTFAYVVMYHVLEHVPDPKAALAEVNRVLKKGGRLLIEVPNVQSVDAKVSRKLMRSVLDVPNHLYAFSPRTLRSLLNGAGFRVIAEERSVPFIITQPLRWMASCLKKEGTSRDQQAEASGRDLFERAPQSSVWKRYLASVLPGMKLALIAEKI